MATSRARKLLLCVCGGYQAHTVPGFIVQLLRHFADDVQVVLSRAAATLVARDAVEVASRNPVFVEMTDRAPGIYVPHIELTRGADLVLVYPATVDLIGKLANGIADELIPALLLACEKPTVIVPVANESMILHPATKRNLEILRSDGYLVIDPPKALEIATREDIDERVGPFPYPTLLLSLSAVVSGKLPASPTRSKPSP
jgi:phosphopantothenoylcysteine decarboxylase/phosphopantothenate--cysteine ligase